jgi:hypothetical protein
MAKTPPGRVTLSIKYKILGQYTAHVSHIRVHLCLNATYGRCSSVVFRARSRVSYLSQIDGWRKGGAGGALEPQIRYVSLSTRKENKESTRVENFNNVRGMVNFSEEFKRSSNHVLHKLSVSRYSLCYHRFSRAGRICGLTAQTLPWACQPALLNVALPAYVGFCICTAPAGFRSLPTMVRCTDPALQTQKGMEASESSFSLISINIRYPFVFR